MIIVVTQGCSFCGVRVGGREKDLSIIWLLSSQFVYYYY